jgi:hypothetical protein
MSSRETTSPVSESTFCQPVARFPVDPIEAHSFAERRGRDRVQWGKRVIEASFLRECEAVHISLPPSSLESGTAENDVKLASGGRHGPQINEVRPCLRDRPCDRGDHPNDRDGGGPPRFSERIDCANCAEANDLSANSGLCSEGSARGPQTKGCLVRRFLVGQAADRLALADHPCFLRRLVGKRTVGLTACMELKLRAERWSYQQEELWVEAFCFG